jgi:hypothetical protein
VPWKVPCGHVAGLLRQRAAELDRRIAERAATLDPKDCPPERVCHLIGG